eukprot:701342-Amphidinium_carterae.1
MSTQAQEVDRLAGSCHLLDFQSVKQKRVTRSTYTAELNGLADSVEQAYATRVSLVELLDPELQKAQYASPADTVKALHFPDFHLPTEASQGLVLLALRDEVHARIDINWVDTRWMLADAMTKGSVSRDQITQAAGGDIELPSGSLVRFRTS